MLLGSLFTLLTGLFWTAVGLTMTRARRLGCHVEHFYIVSSAGAVALILAYLAIWEKVIPSEWSWIVVGFMVVGSLLNAGSNLCRMVNLGGGSAALYFALSGMGFSLSFVWSVLVWGEKAQWYNIIGILCLIGAVVLTALHSHGSGETVSAKKVEYKRLLLALGSTCCSGSSQICFVFPFSKTFAEWNVPQLPPMNKTALIMLTNIVAFAVMALCRRYETKQNKRALMTYGLLWSLLAIGSYAMLFTALKYMGGAGRSGIVFPLGGAVQIVGFALSTRILFKEKLSWLQLSAIGLIVIGIFAVRL